MTHKSYQQIFGRDENNEKNATGYSAVYRIAEKTAGYRIVTGYPARP